jgi:hypothetical protein
MKGGDVDVHIAQLDTTMAAFSISSLGRSTTEKSTEHRRTDCRTLDSLQAMKSEAPSLAYRKANV